MQQNFATVLAASFATLALSGCMAPQPQAGKPTDVSGNQQSTGVAVASPPASATTDLVIGRAQQVPTTGLPSAQFCDDGEAYLAKFPGLPRVNSTSGTTDLQGTIGCAFRAVPGDASVPVAYLSSLALGDSADRAIFRADCDDGQLAPGATRIDADWVRSPGWSAWTAPLGTFQLAILCTENHIFEAELRDIPGATPNDALATILAAVD